MNIVIKLARIKLIGFIRICYRVLTNKVTARLMFCPDIERAWWTGWNCLFGGILANWIERRTFATTRNVFLPPTYITIFGLVNIQRFAQPCTLTDNVLWVALNEICDNDRCLWDDSHHFVNRKNFGWDGDGRLVMCDYGSRMVLPTILKYGDTFHSCINKGTFT